VISIPMPSPGIRTTFFMNYFFCKDKDSGNNV
jgi:hypothetical protein